MEAPLETKITEALRQNGAPMRAIDIVRALAEAGTVIDRAVVNRALYHGPFDQAAEAGAAPTWVPRKPAPGLAPPAGHFLFQVGEVGTFCLRDGLPRESIEALLLAALSLVPEGVGAVVRPDGTEGGKAVAELAADRATVIPF